MIRATKFLFAPATRNFSVCSSPRLRARLPIRFIHSFRITYVFRGNLRKFTKTLTRVRIYELKIERWIRPVSPRAPNARTRIHRIRRIYLFRGEKDGGGEEEREKSIVVVRYVGRVLYENAADRKAHNPYRKKEQERKTGKEKESKYSHARDRAK